MKRLPTSGLSHVFGLDTLANSSYTSLASLELLLQDALEVWFSLYLLVRRIIIRIVWCTSY